MNCTRTLWVWQAIQVLNLFVKGAAYQLLSNSQNWTTANFFHSTVTFNSMPRCHHTCLQKTWQRSYGPSIFNVQREKERPVEVGVGFHLTANFSLPRIFLSSHYLSHWSILLICLSEQQTNQSLTTLNNIISPTQPITALHPYDQWQLNCPSILNTGSTNQSHNSTFVGFVEVN